jgi:hypothetical protein
MKREFFGRSPSAARTSRMCFLTACGSITLPRHTVSSNSSEVTRRPACSARYARTAKAFGVRRMRSSCPASPAAPETLVYGIDPEREEYLHRVPAGPVRVQGASEQKENIGRTTAGSNAPRLRAHEGNTFLIRQAEFLQERVQDRALVASFPRNADQGRGGGDRATAPAHGELQALQQRADRLFLRPQGVLSHRLSKGVRRGVAVHLSFN